MSADWPEISTARIARVRDVIFSSSFAGSIQYISSSISTKTGIAFQCSIAVDLQLSRRYKYFITWFNSQRAYDCSQAKSTS